MAGTYSGADLTGRVEYSANYDGDFWVSPTPINVPGSIVQTNEPVFVQAIGTGTYVDSGVVFSPEVPLGELTQVALAGDFSNTVDSVLNIWIDADGDGSVFAYDATGRLISLDGDVYGSSNTAAKDGVLIADGDTSFYMMAGPTGNQTLAQLKVMYPESKISLWIGVSTSNTAPSLTLDKVVINYPDQVWVNPQWDSSEGVTDSGLVIGVEAFATIQEAVDGVADGGTITLAAGSTFREQVVIQGKSLTLDGNGATLQAFADQVGASILVTEVETVTIRNLTIDGLGAGIPGWVMPDGTDTRFVGIYYRNASGNISDSTITGFHHADGLHGMQSGTAIYVKNADGAERSVTIENNTISDYQKSGIVANLAGLTATIRNNVLTGWGPTDMIAQNGIQIGFGAGGTIEGNTIAGSEYTGEDVACAILLWMPARGTVVRKNVVTSGECGIGGAAIDGAGIAVNDFTGAKVAYNPADGDALGNFTNTIFRDNRLPASDTTSPWVRLDGIGGAYTAGSLVPATIASSDAAMTFSVGIFVDDNGDGEAEGRDLLTGIAGGAVSIPLPLAIGSAWLRLDSMVGTNTVAATTDGFALQRPSQLWVNPGWTGAYGSPTGDGKIIGLDAFATIPEAVRAVADGGTVNIYPGEYGLPADPTWSAQGQAGWYLPIVQDNVTIQGVDENGIPFAAKPNLSSPLPLVYGADFTANGCWASQSLVAVFGDNVTITGLHIMPKVEVNKTIEISGANPTVKYCLFTPNTKTTKEGCDFAADGGALYINGSLIGTGNSCSTIADNYFRQTCVAFDSVQYEGRNDITGNTFDTPRSYLNGNTTVYGYMIGNVTWSNPPATTFTGAMVTVNTFLNYPTSAGYYLIKNRLNGCFTLDGNRMDGRDGSSLIMIDTTTYGCAAGSVQINSWINPGDRTVHSNILIDASGTHRGPVGPRK